MSSKITTPEQAFKKMGINPETLKISGIPEKYIPILEVVFQSIVISEAFRDGWVPDYDNWDERKYEGWYWMDSPSGFRGGDSACARTSSLSVLGSLLSQKTEQESDDFSKMIVPLFKKVLK